ncbi:MAG: MBOAT family O-acyltransferase [Sulfuricellaceae bacterium]|nr:MBOAT family O-acyltransferase [Sulfuricellaceae bacterium]
MIFNSVTYIIFLILAVCLFWVLPKRPRLWMIFLSSMIFYGFWRPEFLAVMILSAATDYFVAIRIEATDVLKKRRLWLLVSLAVNLGLLFYFKYLLFVVDNAIVVMRFFGVEMQSPILNIVLPLGISFYTFQTISYTVDVYRKLIPAERDFVLYGCFVTYFPQLVAGPILRAGELLYQLDAKPKFRLDTFVSGLKRILFGLFLKVVLADNISPLVDAGFAQQISAISAIDVLTLAFLFGFQIYFDFAAYSHIALGSARLMGISFPENFNFPYMASSPREFWRRWHISLSSWIRDYLYLPLLGVKVHDRSVGGLATAAKEHGVSARHPTLVLFVTWGIMGFWHGANWTFVFWGLYHATFIAAHRLVSPWTATLPQFVRNVGGWLITLPIAMLAWVPFRAESVGNALGMYGKLFVPRDYFWLGMRENNYLIAAVLLLGFSGTYFLHERGNRWLRSSLALTFVFETLLMGIIAGLIFVFLRPISQFIYFQF